MAERQHSATDIKRLSLDKIIEAMTADFESLPNHYAQFGVNSQQPPIHNWGDYSNPQVQHYMTNGPPHHTPPAPLQPLNPIPSPMYLPQDLPTYENPQPEPIFYSPQSVNHLEINERNDLIGTIDVGNGNFINVIYGNASQIMVEQCQQLNALGSYNNSNLIDREYGLFTNKQIPVAQNFSPNQNVNGTNGKQLIENLVGNWTPNQSGTYSPFGGSPNVTPDPQTTPEIKEVQEEAPKSAEIQQHKKPRMVAEVKPMRPSYSDVLAKSAPTPVPPAPMITKPKIDGVPKKVSNKSGKSKSKPAVLKRQNSSGSDEYNSPKIQAPRKSVDKNKANLTTRRWVSLDNLGMDNSGTTFETFEKKKDVKNNHNTTNTTNNNNNNSKQSKKGDRNEIVGNLKNQNSSAVKNNCPQKRSTQANSNANTVNNFSQTVAPDNKIEKNQGYGNGNGSKVKEDKKKEKNSKKFQNDKSLKKNRNRKRDTREAVMKNFCKTVSKHTTRWSKIGLKVFYWLLHLICDVVSMSANLFVQLGKCAWYHTILYTKYSWIYMANVFSKVRFLNAIGRQMDRWFGNSRFAFWRKFKTKNDEKDEKENANWIHGGLESNIALPSTGEEAMKRLLACKGKDPYSILGVTSTCSDDDIKKYYKRQAFLVHPDKNNQPGAEEAFKILVHAFDIIGEPERRQAFDQTRQVEAAWGELSDLLSQLHRKMEQAANTIRCTNCGLKHKRVPTQRPCYAARFCAQCKIRHSAKEGDIWAESRVMGFLWHYYACMEGAVYDVTDWAACQARNLKHLRANTHSVQYRIVLGQRPPAQTSGAGKKKQQSDTNASEADFEDFLNNLYNGKPGGTTTNGDQSAFRCDNRRRKTKRKK